MDRVLPLFLLIGLAAIGCGGGANGGGAGTAGTSGASGGAGGTGESRRIIDCGVHSTIGSCGPVTDNCYCSGTRCENPSEGSYFCVFTCVFDSDCVFDIKYAGETVPWEGTCSGGSGSKYCVAKSPTGAAGSGGPGMGGSGGPGSGGSGPGSGGSGPGSGGSGPGSGGSGPGSGGSGPGSGGSRG